MDFIRWRLLLVVFAAVLSLSASVVSWCAYSAEVSSFLWNATAVALWLVTIADSHQFTSLTTPDLACREAGMK